MDSALRSKDGPFRPPRPSTSSSEGQRGIDMSLHLTHLWHNGREVLSSLCEFELTHNLHWDHKVWFLYLRTSLGPDAHRVRVDWKLPTSVHKCGTTLWWDVCRPITADGKGHSRWRYGSASWETCQGKPLWFSRTVYLCSFACLALEQNSVSAQLPGATRCSLSPAPALCIDV